MKHYDTDRDLVVGAGVQAPWPGALYAKPAVVHAHSHRGALRRSYMPEQTLDGFSGHYCGMGSTDSFGMPLAGASLSGTDEDFQSLGGTIIKGIIAGVVITGMIAFLAKD